MVTTRHATPLDVGDSITVTISGSTVKRHFRLSPDHDSILTPAYSQMLPVHIIMGLDIS